MNVQCPLEVGLANSEITKYNLQYHQELIIVVRESIQRSIGLCKMNA